LLAYLCGELQAQHVKGMMSNVPAASLCSFERDGFVFYDERGTIEITCSIPITDQKYDPYDAVLALARAKYPHIDFDRPATISMDSFKWARRSCLSALAAEKPVAPASTDLGTVIAYRLESRVFVGTESDNMEVFDEAAGLWRVVKGDKVLKGLVREAVLQEFRPKKASYVEGKLVLSRSGPTPGPMKSQKIRNTTVDECTSLLRRDPSRPLDGEATRRLLLDSAGMVYDFNSDTTRCAAAGIRLSRRLPFRFSEEWVVDAGAKARLSDLLEEVFRLWLAGHGGLGDSPHGQAIAQSILTLVAGAGFEVWNVLLPIYGGNLDLVLWELLHFAADASSWERRCEFVYRVGPGGCGKDVLVVLRTSFFGSRDQGGLSMAVPPTFFTSRHAVNPDAPSTTLESMRGMKFVVSSEVPAHTHFAVDVAKALTEQQGAYMTSRGLYSSPVSWRPTAGLEMTSNHDLVLTDEQMSDSGLRRRLFYVKHSAVLLNSGRDVKARILSGAMNAELMWLAKKFFGYLRRMANGTRLVPIPKAILDDSAELLDQNRAQDARLWLEAHTTPAAKIDQGTLATAVRRAAAEALSVDEKAADALLKTAGCRTRRVGAGIFLMWLYPEGTAYKAVKLAV
jgi:hypothetical protein